MIQAMVLLAGAIYIVINLVVDVSYGLLDPRVRVERHVERV
jgi:peptide/nickel transport system permease protein